MPQPERYVLSATLITCSPLAIHSDLGSEELQSMGRLPRGLPFRRKSQWNDEPLESCDQLVVRDGFGRPYIPGSSLKGVMREHLTREVADPEKAMVNWLLGTPTAMQRSNATVQQDERGGGGAGIFEDALLDTLGEGVGSAAIYCVQIHRQWFDAVSSRRGVFRQIF